MTTAYTYRPPNPHARRAGLLILGLAALALICGGVTLMGGVMLPTLEQDAAFAARLDVLRHQFPPETNLRLVFILYGSLVLVYAVVAAVLGFLVRGGNQIVLVIALIVTICVTIVISLSVVAALFVDPTGALMPILVLAAHTLVLKWLTSAVRFSAKTAVTYDAPPPQRPMQAYYTPPIKPVGVR